MKMRKILMMILTSALGLGAWGVTVTTEADLRTAIANGGTVTLGGNIALTEEIAVGTTVTLDLGTYTLSSPTNVFRVAANGNFTVNADASNPGGIYTTATNACVYTAYGLNPGPKTIVINGGVFDGNCVFNFSDVAAANIKQRYGIDVAGAGSGEKADPTSVTINGGTFQGGYSLGNVGAYRCYYFTVNGGTFEKGLDCADTATCSIGATTTCKAFFKGGKYRGKYPAARTHDTNRVFIGTETTSYVYCIQDGYYVIAPNHNACEATGTYVGNCVADCNFIERILNGGLWQKWTTAADTWYFASLDEAYEIATDVVPLSGGNVASAPAASPKSSATIAAQASPVSGRRLLAAAPKSARLLSSSVESAENDDILVSRPEGELYASLGEIKVAGPDSFLSRVAALNENFGSTELKKQLNAGKVDAHYQFLKGVSSSDASGETGNDDTTIYEGIYKRVQGAMTGTEAEMLNALMALRFTDEERDVLIRHADELESIYSSSQKTHISENSFTPAGDNKWELNFANEGYDGFQAVVGGVFWNPTISSASTVVDPFDNDPYRAWNLSIAVSFDGDVDADSVRFWYAYDVNGYIGNTHLLDTGVMSESLVKDVCQVLNLASSLEVTPTLGSFCTGGQNSSSAPMYVAVQNLSGANIGKSVKVAFRLTNPNNANDFIDRAYFVHKFTSDTLLGESGAVVFDLPSESEIKNELKAGTMTEYNVTDNVEGGYDNDNGDKIINLFKSIINHPVVQDNVVSSGLENVSIQDDDDGSKYVSVSVKRLEWRKVSGGPYGYDMIPTPVSWTFSVTPMFWRVSEDNGANIEIKRAIKNEEIGGKTITFRLPLTDDFTAKARVVHTSEGYPTERWIADVGGEAGARYVEISTTHFSTFTVSPVSANVATTSVQASNLFGAIEVTGGASNMYVAVPFEGFGSAGAARAASNVVHAANLANGAKMFAWDKSGDKYNVYEVEGGAWMAPTKVTVTAEGKTVVENAPLDFGVAAGTGVILQRPNSSGTVYVYGQIPSAAEPVTFGGGQTLVSPPYTNATVEVGGVKYVDLNAAKWTGVKGTTLMRLVGRQNADYIQFRNSNGGFVKYFYLNGNGGGWGVTPTEEERFGELVKDGRALVPVGTALWYYSTSGGATVEWK